uniref:RAB11 family interacting protein 4 n=1 Tax=Ornithorhynchus anatinus TaxID=9258 RepID=A0A6I8PL73_ORNAN
MAGGSGRAGGPAPVEPLARSLRRLREVFDVCGRDPDGFLRVDRFVALALQFGQGEEVEKLVKFLDPHDLGRITFKDFCHGVFAIKGGDFPGGTMAGRVPCQPVPICVPWCQDPAAPALDGDGIPAGPGLFAHEDTMTLARQETHHEPDMDGAIESAPSSEVSDVSPGEEKDGGLSGPGGLFLPGDKSSSHHPSDLSSHSTASLVSNEEQFEDYGEGEDVDYIPSSPCPDDETRTNACSDLGSSVSSSAGQTPRKVRHVYNNELLDVYCSQCCKKINLLNDLEARLKHLKASSPNRKISSTAFGRQLLHHSNLSSSNGSTEDLFRDSIDSCDNDLTEKVSFLEKKVTELENDSLTNGDLKSKLKQENIQLVHRVHELEEIMKDQETMAEQTLEEETKRHRDAYGKLEKEMGTELELLNSRVLQLEEENGDLKTTVTRLKSQTEKLDEERQRMSDRLEDTSLRLKDEMDLYKKMMDKLRQNRQEFHKEREATQELIEDLRKELEHLQLYKLDCERPGRGRSASSSLSEFNAKAREVELEHEVKRLKQENQKLRDQNDDLNGQILSLSLYEAKNLFATQTKAQSLAAEIDTASRDELMEALKEQEEINLRLRQYMDKIILAILDHNPSILEIKN